MSNKSKTSIDLVIENLFSIHPLLSKNYTRAIRTKTNHTPGTLFVLGALHRHGKLSMSEIGYHIAVPKPHVTTLIDKLIANELVERLYDPADRRIIYIQITEKGANDFIAIKKEISQDLNKRLQLLSKEQLQILTDASLQVKDILMLIFQNQQSVGSSTLSKKN